MLKCGRVCVCAADKQTQQQQQPAEQSVLFPVSLPHFISALTYFTIFIPLETHHEDRR